MPVMDELGFERVEEALHRGIVIAVALAAHRGLEAGGPDHLAVVLRSILNAAIGMVDQAGPGRCAEMAIVNAADGRSARK